MAPKKQPQQTQPVVSVDPSVLPRVSSKLSKGELKTECAARGTSKNTSSLSKDQLLEKLVDGSVCISKCREYLFVEEVKRLMSREVSQLERKQRDARLDKLHTFEAEFVHPCLLAHTREIEGRRHSATCNSCFRKCCEWSCAKCDFDICSQCFNATEEATMPREDLVRKRKREEEAALAEEEAELFHLSRNQRCNPFSEWMQPHSESPHERPSLKREEEERKARKEAGAAAKLGTILDKHRKVPDKNKKPSGSGFTVWSSSGYPSDGFHSYDGPPEKEFDSSWPSAADANQRAKYLFYAENVWGLGADELIENHHVEKKTVGPQKLLKLEVHPDDSEVWTVAVVPDQAFEHLREARQGTDEEDVVDDQGYGYCLFGF